MSLNGLEKFRVGFPKPPIRQSGSEVGIPLGPKGKEVFLERPDISFETWVCDDTDLLYGEWISDRVSRYQPQQAPPKQTKPARGGELVRRCRHRGGELEVTEFGDPCRTWICHDCGDVTSRTLPYEDGVPEKPKLPELKKKKGIVWG
jgi:hypothetical protein